MGPMPVYTARAIYIYIYIHLRLGDPCLTRNYFKRIHDRGAPCGGEDHVFLPSILPEFPDQQKQRGNCYFINAPSQYSLLVVLKLAHKMGRLNLRSHKHDAPECAQRTYSRATDQGRASTKMNGIQFLESRVD
jgi:hypothetical protein